MIWCPACNWLNAIRRNVPRDSCGTIRIKWKFYLKDITMVNGDSPFATVVNRCSFCSGFPLPNVFVDSFFFCFERICGFAGPDTDIMVVYEWIKSHFVLGIYEVGKNEWRTGAYIAYTGNDRNYIWDWLGLCEQCLTIKRCSEHKCTLKAVRRVFAAKTRRRP